MSTSVLSMEGSVQDRVPGHLPGLVPEMALTRDFFRNPTGNGSRFGLPDSRFGVPGSRFGPIPVGTAAGWPFPIHAR
jgi:hypothetical protein